MTGLKIEGLTSGYGDKTIVHNICLDLTSSRTLVLMGPSGSGKTTLLLTILGIIRPKSGTVLLDGIDILPFPIEDRGIGYLPQDYGLFPHMNVQDNVTFGLRVRNIASDVRDAVAQEMLDLVDLKGYGDRDTRELSGGEKQRVGLARALAIRPKLLLLDEPLSNIDQVTRREVAEQLKSLCKKLSIPTILVTHNTEDASFLAETIAIMIEGRIAQYGDFGEVKTNPQTNFIKRLLNPFA